MSEPDEIVWRPSAESIRRTRLHSLVKACGFDAYDEFAAFCLEDPEAHWRVALKQMGIRLEFTQFMDITAGKAWPRWFIGSTFNCVSPILAAASNPDTAGEIALICENEAGDVRILSRSELGRKVEQMAASLARRGIARGDRVAMLLPNREEAVLLPLACAFLGAIFVPLYSGFGPKPIADRVSHSGARLLVTAGSTQRGGRALSLIDTAREVLRECPGLERILVVADDTDTDPALPPRIERWTFDGERTGGRNPANTDPNDPVMLVYTSGTTGAPKGTVHSHAGFPLRLAYDLAFIFDVHPGDRFFWFSDMGWMIGPMVVFGPLLLGATSVLYEGSPTHPDARRLFEIAARHQVTHFGTSPTMVRSWKAFDARPNETFQQKLKVLLTAGEIIDPESFCYLFETIGGGRPVINYTGGTEVSGGLLANLLVKPIAPSSFNAPAPGVALSIRDENGMPISASDVVGELAIDNLFPGMTHGLWNAAESYLETYWSRFSDSWSHGDLVQRRGAFWEVKGRADDVLKISGRRIGPGEVEAVVLALPGIASVAAIGLPDDRIGEALHVFVVVRTERPTPIAAEIASAIVDRLGKAFRPSSVHFVSDLPRTRNNKTLRRVIKRIAQGLPAGDLSSIDNPESLKEIPRIG